MRCRSVSLFALMSVAACAASPPLPVATQAPPRVILFVGDGAGTAYWTAARFASDALSIERFTVVGLVDTRSASNRVTDSAAGATVYATGVRTYNGAIGVGPDREPRRTVLEVAERNGMATGLVATSTITHATPASFAAHVVDRAMQAEIARQYAGQEIEVLLGGGRAYFDGTGDDASALLPELRQRYAYIESAAALRSLDPDTVPALLGLFAEGGMPPAAERSPRLPEMTRTALEILDRDPDGFFLLVEGSQPDWRGHANQPLAAVTAEMLDLDAAIGVALEYQQRHPETLVVVVADHETGGLALEEDESGGLVADYTTDHHTAAMIPLFARGPGAERFGGLVTNARVGELLLEAVGGARVPATVGTR